MNNNDIINEVKVERTLVKKLERSGALIGIEFEFVVPDIQLTTKDDLSDLVSDFSRDQTVKNIQQIVDFYTAAPPINNQDDIQRLAQDLALDYATWRREQRSKLWQKSALSAVKKYIIQNSKIMQELKLAARLEQITTQDEFLELLDSRAREIIRKAQAPVTTIRDNFFKTNAAASEATAESAWLKQQLIDRTSDVLLKYDYIVWPYQQAQVEAREITNLAKQFSKTIKQPVIASTGSKALDRDRIIQGSWGIIPDITVQGNDRYAIECGLEFVSPPVKFQDLATMIDTMRDFARANGYYTNVSTGLHFNISTANYSVDNLDYVKLVLLIGDEQILEQFERAAGRAVEYASSSLKDIKSVLKQGDASTIKTRLEQIAEYLRSGCHYAAAQLIRQRNVDKYYSVNVHPTYVEFRAPGGDYLATDRPQYSTARLVNLARRLALALTAACDPQAQRELYAKKLDGVLQNIAQQFDNSHDRNNNLQRYIFRRLEQNMLNITKP